MGNVIITKDGRAYAIDESAVADAQRQGFAVEGADQHASRLGQEQREAEYGGAAGTVLAGAAGVARGVTLGASDALLAAGGLGDDLRNLQEQNPAVSTAGEIGGALVTGHGPSPAGLAQRAGKAIATGGAKGVARAAVGAAAEGALFGAGSGVSELALSDDPLTLEHAVSTLSSKALFGAAVGGAAGGLGKLAEKGLVKAKGALDSYRAARDVASDLPEDLAALDAKGLRGAHEEELARIEGARVGERSSLADDVRAHRATTKDAKVWLATKGVADTDVAGVKVIGKQALNADKQLDRILDNPKAFAERPEQALSALQKQEHALEQIATHDTKLRELATKSDDALPRSSGEFGDEGAELATGQRFREGETLEIPAKEFESRGYYEPVSGRAEADSARMDAARQAIKEGQRDPITVTMDSKGRIEVENGRHRLDAAIELDAPIKVRFFRAAEGLSDANGPIEIGMGDVVRRGSGDGFPSALTTANSKTAALDAVGPALERNRALQGRIRDVIATPASERLAKIADAKDALAAAAAKPKSVGEQILGGMAFGVGASAGHAVPGLGAILGPLAGAKASKFATDLVFGRLGKAAGEAAAKTSAAVDLMIRGVAKGTPFAAVGASKALSAIRYAPDAADAREVPGDAKQPARAATALADAYRARSQEIRSQVQPDPATGAPMMRPDARARIADMLVGVRAANPIAADRMETVAARRLEYLASKLPKRPDLPLTPGGKDTWHPSDMEMRTFARQAAAVEDPGHVELQLAHGTLTPEAVEAYKAVYPERAAALTLAVLGALPDLKARLPYKRRLALSMFTGQAVSPELDPRVIAQLQRSYDAEEGGRGESAGAVGPGGMQGQAPLAMPAFGSVKVPDASATPAQERAG